MVTDAAEGIDRQQLLRRAYPILLRFANVVRPLEVDPDDLVQEALVRWLQHGTARDIEAVVPYIRRIIVNLAANERRGLGRRRRAMVRLYQPDVALPTYPSDLADLRALPPFDRAVLYLVVVEGRTFVEVAGVLSCKENTARVRYQRARRRLQSGGQP